MSDTSTSGQALEPVMTETVRALVRRLSRTRREFAEAMPCTWCNNIGVVPEEAFGRDEDGAPMVDGVQPCPEGCEVPRWLQAERNDARDDAAELDRLSAAADPATGQAREPVMLVDLRARIAAAFAAVDNFTGEPPTREQLDWAHIAACVVLNIGQDQPSGDTVHPPAEPSDAWVIGRFADATAQHGDRTFEMWDDDVHRTSAAALHHHVMHVEDPDPWSWHIYALVRIAAPGSAGDTVQVPDVAAVLDRLNVAELAGDEEQEFNDGQRWMLQKIRRALLGTTQGGAS